jgi:hypothetical protein
LHEPDYQQLVLSLKSDSGDFPKGTNLMMLRHSALLLAASAGVQFVLGCSGGANMAEVQGTVKVNGKGIDKIHVEFWPLSSGPRSMGNTDSEGHFELMTDDGKRKGAVVGSHKVVLRDHGLMAEKYIGKDIRELENVDINEGRKPRISLEYYDPEKSTLTQQVVAGETNQIDLEVKAGEGKR